MYKEYDFDYFGGSDLKYPKKPIKPTLGRNPSSVEARAFADALEEYERELESYKEDLADYRLNLSYRSLQFEDKLKLDYDLSDQEFSTIWSEAYERGHSDGLNEVYNHFDQLYSFVEKYMKVSRK